MAEKEGKNINTALKGVLGENDTLIGLVGGNVRQIETDVEGGLMSFNKGVSKSDINVDGGVTGFEPIGEVAGGDKRAVSGNEVFNTYKDYSQVIIRKNLFNPFNILQNTTVGVTGNISTIATQQGSEIAFIQLNEVGDYYIQMLNFNIVGFRLGLFSSVTNDLTGVRVNSNKFTITEQNKGYFLCFGIKYQDGNRIDLTKIQVEKGSEPTDIIPYSSVELINQNQVNTLENKVDELLKLDNKEKYTYQRVGINLINNDDLLRGVTYSATSGLIESEFGILSNKIRFESGDYIIQGLQPYATERQRFIGFNDKDEVVEGFAVEKNAQGNYVFNFNSLSKFFYVNYFRIVLQFDDSLIYDDSKVILSKGNTPIEFEKSNFITIENPYYGKDKFALMSGASNAATSNGWFEWACEKSGVKYNNVAISGESVMQAATKAWRGELWNFEQLDKMDLLVLSHTHNYNVNFSGVEYQGELLGFKNFTNEGVINDNNNYITYKFNIKQSIPKLIVNTICAHSSGNYIACFDINDTLLGIFLTNTDTTPTAVNFEFEVPLGTSYVLVKKYNIPFKVTLKEPTMGVLCSTVSEYESKGYDENNQPLTVPLDKENPNHRIVTYGSLGSRGTLQPNNEINERYSAGFDYLIKKYKQDCYDLKNNPLSKWYGSPFGKPTQIIICSYWHDGYVVYNESARELSNRLGATYCDIANNVGFTYKTTNPNDENSLRDSYLYCNNRLYSSSNDSETIPINGVNYTNMGWHATRDMLSDLTKIRGSILASTLEKLIK